MLRTRPFLHLAARAALLATSLLADPRGAAAQAAPPAPTHPFAARTVTSADGTRIAYLVAGTGRPLVMVHGSMTVADEWLPVADRLAATRHLVVVERRGRGRSGDAAPHSLALEAQDLAAVVADVGGPTAVDLFGHSYGGAVVGRYAIKTRFPGAVVLYDPGAGLNGPIAAEGRAPVRALLDAGQRDPALRDSALTRAFQTIMGTPPAVIAGIRQNAPLWTQYRTLLPSWIREVESLDAFAPTAEELGRIRGRTTIVLGEQSGPMLTAITRTWVSGQPGVAVLPLSGQGHTGYLEAPAYVAERIQAALGAPPAALARTTQVSKTQAAIPDAITADPAHYTVEFENTEVRVLRIRYGPHAKGNMHDHPRSVTVFLTPGHLRMTVPGRAPMEATVKAGTVAWEDAGPHQPENLSDQPFEAVRTEFKTPDPRATSDATRRSRP
jgi:pimeloyl-ACP methyl ester carboxylesterase/uncharacterized RmlC-like cupin family protein